MSARFERPSISPLESPVYRIGLLLVVLLIAMSAPLNAQSLRSDTLRLEFSHEPGTRLLVTPTLVGFLPGCPPRQARFKLDEGRFSGEVFVFDRPAICAAVVVESVLPMPQMFFPRMGIYRIRVMDEQGLIDNLEVAVQGLVVNGEVGSFGKHSVAGTWYDPKSPGSGLIFAHSRGNREESVFGTWTNFDANGAPQWHSLQGEGFAGSTTLLGSVYRSVGANCGLLFECTNPLLARPQVALVRNASFRFILESATRATLIFESPGSERREIQLQKLF